MHLHLRLQLQLEMQKGWLQFNVLRWEHWPLDFRAWSTHPHFLHPADPRCRYLGFRPRPLPPIFQCQEKIQVDDIGFKDCTKINERRIPASHLQFYNHNNGSSSKFQNNCNFYRFPKKPSNFQCPICLAVLSWPWYPPLRSTLRGTPRSSSAPASTDSSTCIQKHMRLPVRKYPILSKHKNMSDSNLHETFLAKPRKIDFLNCVNKTSKICIPTGPVDQRLNKCAKKLDAEHLVKFAEFQQNSKTIGHSHHVPIYRKEFAKSRGQCKCGYDGMSCAPDCTFCCALECAAANSKFDIPSSSQNQGSQLKPVSSLAAHSRENSGTDIIRDDFPKIQCRCGPDKNSCAADCNHCCALNCTSGNIRLYDPPTDNKCLSKGQAHPQQCVCGFNKMSCASNCEFCCAKNCTTQSTSRDKDRNTVTKKIDENRSNTVLKCVSLLSTELNTDKKQIEKCIERNVQSPSNSKVKINIGNP